MPDPFTAAIAGYIAVNLHHWLEDLRAILFVKGKEFVTIQRQEGRVEPQQRVDGRPDRADGLVWP